LTEKEYTLNVFNTVTGKLEEVAVTADVYHAYRRGGWNIENRERRFYQHEITFTNLIGNEDDSFECFREFCVEGSDPCHGSC